MSWQILHADARHIPLVDKTVQCVVTSPPYWGLRDYGLDPLLWGGDKDCEHEWGAPVIVKDAHSDKGTSTLSGSNRNQMTASTFRSESAFCPLCGAWRGTLGLEPTPELYVQHGVEIFREVRRVLRDDGTLWLNMGDCYCSTAPGTRNAEDDFGGRSKDPTQWAQHRPNTPAGLKPKDLVGMPWRVAFALQADGWWLRSDIIWAKPNPMPESVTDRPTKSHEYLFLLTKSERYYYDQDAVREPMNYPERTYSPNTDNHKTAKLAEQGNRCTSGLHDGREQYGNPEKGRNIRTVWTIATQPFPEAHFATFPEALVEPCIKAGSGVGGLVMDPFAGSGTVGVVALRLGRSFVGLELQLDYVEMARRRIENDAPLLNRRTR